MEELFPILWDEDRQVLVLLDQTRLPGTVAYVDCWDGESVFRAIRDMIVRGAPAIGVTAGYGLYLATRGFTGTDEKAFLDHARDWAGRLGASRPTAVNLTWALNRVYERAASMRDTPVEARKKAMLDLAKRMHAEDERINRRIGEHLLTLLKDGMGVLTHCNAGQLATTRYGTATSPMYLSKERGWHLHIYADETRPRLQGSTLTALELYRAGLDVTVICDTMTATVMAQGKIDAAIVGCDRVAANGDAANKIGTMGVAILAKHFGIPFYVAAPISSIDGALAHGGLIPIEERDPSEVVEGFGRRTAPEGVKVYNPSFDVTPNELITAIVTEKGILRPPYGPAIAGIL